MSFVYEEIPEEDKQHIDFKEVYSKTGYEKQTLPTEWTINREYGAFMIAVITDREPPHISECALVWQGEIFRVFFDRIETPSEIAGKLDLTKILVDIKYRYGLEVPNDLKQTAIELVLEAICVRDKAIHILSTKNPYSDFKAISKV